MKNTIKIIDLLNKIANKEEVPKKIKYNNEIWKYMKSENDYTNVKKFLFMDNIMNYDSVETFLNLEVEIIEEIEKPKKVEKLKYRCGDFAWNLLKEQQEEIRIAVNYLLEKSKDNEI